MKIIIVLLGFCLFGSFYSQKVITWEDLRCDAKEVWSDDYHAVYLQPIFNRNQLSLDSVFVEVQGNLFSYFATEEYFVLSKNEIDLNSHWSASSPEEFIEIEFKSKTKGQLPNAEVKVKGVLLLNSTDVLHLFYILKDAVIVEK